MGPGNSNGRDLGNAANSRASGKPTGGAAGFSAPKLAWRPLDTDQTVAMVELIGVDPIALAVLGNPEVTREEWSSFLAVRVVPETPTPSDSKPPPLIGTYTATREGIRFKPRFPLEPGLRFRAEFDPVAMHTVAQRHLLLCGSSHADWQITFTTKLTADFAPPRRPPAPPTSVIEVFPTASLLPENLLRFYIHFSAPMSRGEAYARIHLVDATDHVVSDPFLELAEELWSNDGTRFTLLIDPGRIKRGLKPREEVGPVLEAGKAYALVIDREWLDANGNPLRTGFRKSFRAAAPDEASPDPKTWTINSPEPGSRDPLEVRFSEALDRALLDRMIAVTSDAGIVSRGTVSTSEGEKVWRFTPDAPWRGGRYQLRIMTDLEDVAGNSVAKPFEVDATGPVTARVVSESVTLPFRINTPAQ